MNGGYRVTIVRTAQKSLAGIPSPDFERVRDALRSLSGDPRPAGCKKLVNRSGWRVRVGRFRVIYEIDDAGSKAERADRAAKRRLGRRRPLGEILRSRDRHGSRFFAFFAFAQSASNTR